MIEDLTRKNAKGCMYEECGVYSVSQVNNVSIISSMKVLVSSLPPYFLLRVLRLPVTGVVDRLDDFLDDVEVLLFAGAFFAGAFLAGDLAGDLAGAFLAADLEDADAERLVLVERLGFGLADLAAAGFAAVFLADAERPLVDFVEALLLAGDLDLAAAFFAAGFFVTLRLRLAGSATTSAAASATFAVGFVDLEDERVFFGAAFPLPPDFEMLENR
mmetsp:Transcript_5742/g.16110  ORF Transcript_5742/g.16110 Transcript_5742/m.16110 type:complete len:216 (+) Transcript_5742:2083-2730(+)